MPTLPVSMIRLFGLISKGDLKEIKNWFIKNPADYTSEEKTNRSHTAFEHAIELALSDSNSESTYWPIVNFLLTKEKPNDLIVALTALQENRPGIINFLIIKGMQLPQKFRHMSLIEDDAEHNSGLNIQSALNKQLENLDLDMDNNNNLDLYNNINEQLDNLDLDNNNSSNNLTLYSILKIVGLFPPSRKNDMSIPSLTFEP